MIINGQEVKTHRSIHKLSFFQVINNPEVMDHMSVQPRGIYSYSFLQKLRYYPRYWYGQYQVTCKYWNKPVKNRWFWRIFYATIVTNLLIWPKGEK